MRDIRTVLREFDSLRGYFFSDKKALFYLSQNIKLWGINDIRGKVGVLGIHRLIPDQKLRYVLEILAEKEVQQAAIEGDTNFLVRLYHELSFLDEAKFIASKFLCGHRPDHFPIWDIRRVLIREWETKQLNFTYSDLNVKINDYISYHDLNDLDYYYFNKLLWYCE